MCLQSIEERIRAHEAHIQKLKQDLEMRQTRKQSTVEGSRTPMGGPQIIELDEPPRRRRGVPKADHNDFFPWEIMMIQRLHSRRRL